MKSKKQIKPVKKVLSPYVKERIDFANSLMQKYTDLRKDQVCFDALCQTLLKVELAPEYVSGMSLTKSGKLVGSEDLPKWKEQTRKDIQRVADMLSKIIDLLEGEPHVKRTKGKAKKRAAKPEDSFAFRVDKLRKSIASTAYMPAQRTTAYAAIGSLVSGYKGTGNPLQDNTFIELLRARYSDQL